MLRKAIVVFGEKRGSLRSRAGAAPRVGWSLRSSFLGQSIYC